MQGGNVNLWIAVLIRAEALWRRLGACWRHLAVQEHCSRRKVYVRLWLCALLLAAMGAPASAGDVGDGCFALNGWQDFVGAVGKSAKTTAVAVDKEFSPDCRKWFSDWNRTMSEEVARSMAFYTLGGMCIDSRFSELSEQERMRAVRMAKCAAAVYGGKDIPESFRLPPDELCGNIISGADCLRRCSMSEGGRVRSESGLSARIMVDKMSGDLVVSFAGVESEKDGRIDAALNAIFGGMSDGQLNEACALLQSVCENYKGNVIVVGHSFGGLLAVYAMSKLPKESQVKGCLFNPLGIPFELYRKMDGAALKIAAKRMTTFRHPYDFALNLPGRHPGKSYLLEEKGVPTVEESHSIDYMIRIMSR